MNGIIPGFIYFSIAIILILILILLDALLKKKSAKVPLWVKIPIVFIIIAAAINLLSMPQDIISFPKLESSGSIRLKLVDKNELIGSTEYVNSNEIEDILTSLETGRKTRQSSVNDTPTNIPVFYKVEIDTLTGVRTLYLYKKYWNYYVEEPYSAIYKINKAAFTTIKTMYNAAPNP